MRALGRLALVCGGAALLAYGMELVHSSAGVWRPAQGAPSRGWIVPVYFCGLFFAGVLFHRLERRMPRPVEPTRRAVIAEAAAVLALAALPALLFRNEVVLLVIAAAYLAYRLLQHRAPFDGIVVGAIAVADLVVELLLVEAGIYSYAVADWMPVPLWLAPLWGGLGLGLRRVFALAWTSIDSRPARVRGRLFGFGFPWLGGWTMHVWNLWSAGLAVYAAIAAAACGGETVTHGTGGASSSPTGGSGGGGGPADGGGGTGGTSGSGGMVGGTGGIAGTGDADVAADGAADGGTQCGEGGTCVAPGVIQCPAGLQMTQMGCDYGESLGQCCVPVEDAGAAVGVDCGGSACEPAASVCCHVGGGVLQCVPTASCGEYNVVSCDGAEDCNGGPCYAWAGVGVGTSCVSGESALLCKTAADCPNGSCLPHPYGGFGKVCQ